MPPLGGVSIPTPGLSYIHGVKEPLRPPMLLCCNGFPPSITVWSRRVARGFRAPCQPPAQGGDWGAAERQTGGRGIRNRGRGREGLRGRPRAGKGHSSRLAAQPWP